MLRTPSSGHHRSRIKRNANRLRYRVTADSHARKTSRPTKRRSPEMVSFYKKHSLIESTPSTRSSNRSHAPAPSARSSTSSHAQHSTQTLTNTVICKHLYDSILYKHQIEVYTYIYTCNVGQTEKPTNDSSQQVCLRVSGTCLLDKLSKQTRVRHRRPNIRHLLHTLTTMFQ